ncbi:MAG: C4-dicarboxylate ABC transporter substrate-binding protein [Gammaproteobacteria bacterium]|nr:MAG: C4-dicarboxylate ABC transporter substrate-binding protein [Gammaproteobacteria bacterium]
MSYKLLKSACILSGVLLAFSGFAEQKWKMALGDGMGSTQEAIGKKFSEIIKEKTKGDINIEIFPGGQLGSEQATANDVSMGTLELAVLGSNNLAPFSPSMGILALPYIFENIDQAKTILEGEIGKALAEDVLKNANVRILGWTYSGYRMLTNSKHPVTNMGELKDLIIRVPKTEILIGSFKAWGINPTPMAWSETFTALQQKVVDGQTSPYAAIHSMKFGELQKYLTEMSYMYQLEPLIISESLFQKQTPEVQKALLEAGGVASEYALNWLNEKENSIKEELKSKYGVQIDVLTDEDQWVKAAQEKVWPQFYDQVGGKEKVNEFLRALGRKEL